MWIDILYITLAAALVYVLYLKFGTGVTLEEPNPQEQQREEEAKKAPHKKGWKKEKRKEDKLALKQEKKQLDKWQRIEQEESQQSRRTEQAFKQLAAEQNKKDQAQMKQWEGQFKILAQGNQKLSQAQKARMREQTKRKLKETLDTQKCVYLQQIGVSMGMKVKELVQLLQEMEASSEIIGIFDQRGRYLKLQVSQLQQLVQFLVSRGKISKQQFAAHCQRILVPAAAQSDEMAKHFESQFLKISDKE